MLPRSGLILCDNRDDSNTTNDSRQPRKCTCHGEIPSRTHKVHSTLHLPLILSTTLQTACAVEANCGVHVAAPNDASGGVSVAAVTVLAAADAIDATAPAPTRACPHVLQSQLFKAPLSVRGLVCDGDDSVVRLRPQIVPLPPNSGTGNTEHTITGKLWYAVRHVFYRNQNATPLGW